MKINWTPQNTSARDLGQYCLQARIRVLERLHDLPNSALQDAALGVMTEVDGLSERGISSPLQEVMAPAMVQALDLAYSVLLNLSAVSENIQVDTQECAAMTTGLMQRAHRYLSVHGYGSPGILLPFHAPSVLHLDDVTRKAFIGQVGSLANQLYAGAKGTRKDAEESFSVVRTALLQATAWCCDNPGAGGKVLPIVTAPGTQSYVL